MNLTELTEFLIKNIVKDPDTVSVKMFETDEEFITIEVLVSNEDMGAVIGKGGKIANIIQASAYANNLKKVRINIDSI